MNYGKKYFTSGNYKDYLSRNNKYKNLAEDLCFIKKLGVKKILDFGCGIGFLTLNLSKKGFNCIGYDKSKWAVNYGIKNLNANITNNQQILKLNYDCVIALDVLEHNNINQIKKILSIKTKFIIIRIPVSVNSKNYYLAKSRKDKTHITCMNKKNWKDLFEKENLIEIMRIKKNSIWDSTGVYCALLKINDKS